MADTPTLLGTFQSTALSSYHFLFVSWPRNDDVLKDFAHDDDGRPNETPNDTRNGSQGRENKALRWANFQQQELEYLWKNAMFLAAFSAAALSWLEGNRENSVVAKGAFGGAAALAVVTVYQSSKQLRTLNRLLLQPEAARAVKMQLGWFDNDKFKPSAFKTATWQSAIVLHNAAFIAVSVGSVGIMYPAAISNSPEIGVIATMAVAAVLGLLWMSGSMISIYRNLPGDREISTGRAGVA